MLQADLLDETHGRDPGCGQGGPLQGALAHPDRVCAGDRASGTAGPDSGSGMRRRGVLRWMGSLVTGGCQRKTSRATSSLAGSRPTRARITEAQTFSGGSGETAWQRRARRSSMGVCLRSISPSVKSTAPCRAPAAWCWPAGVGRRRHRSGYRPPCRPGRRAVGGWRPRAGSGPPRRCAAARSPGRARRRTRVGGFQRVGAQGTAHAPHDHRRVQPGAGHVAHHQAELTGGQREHVVPVAADPTVPGHVPGGDLHAR